MRNTDIASVGDRRPFTTTSTRDMNLNIMTKLEHLLDWEILSDTERAVVDATQVTQVMRRNDDRNALYVVPHVEYCTRSSN